MDEGAGQVDLIKMAADCPEEQSSSSKALQNDLIVSNVLSFLEIRDLKACSLVNHLWKNESRPLMAKQSPPVLFDDCMGGMNWEKAGVYGMEKLTDEISFCAGIFPCSIFQVDTEMVTCARDETVLDSFFEAVAPFARQIRICSSLKEGSYRKTMAAHAKYDKLERLELELPGFVVPATATYPKSNGLRYFAGILDQAPNLKAICFPGFYGSSLQVHSVLNLLDCPAAQNIQQLAFRGNLDNPHLIRLASMSFKLRVLELTTCSSEIYDDHPGVREGIWTFLESQSGTLETLMLEDVFASSDDYTDKIILPTLPKLKSLTICAHNDWLFEKFQALNYHTQLPNLTHLSLKKFSVDPTPFLSANLNLAFETLEHLELPQLKKTELSWIETAASLFPKVRKLEMFARKDAFQAVCAHFGHVEHLTLHNNWIDCHSTNIILTGLPTKILEQTQELTPVQRSVLEEHVDTPPEFLQNLRVLQLEDTPRKRNLTDRACQLVLLKLNSLECLNLTKSFSSRISEPVLEQMRTKFMVLCEQQNIQK